LEVERGRDCLAVLVTAGHKLITTVTTGKEEEVRISDLQDCEINM